MEIANLDLKVLRKGDTCRCKWLLLIMQSRSIWDESLLQSITHFLGTIDYLGPFQHFTNTTYYQSEFGSNLWRAWLGIRELGDPSQLLVKKKICTALEEKEAVNGCRKYNIDVGYLDPDKLVLASWKRGPNKLYLGDGIWADVQFNYSKGIFIPTRWAFPDLNNQVYLRDLKILREKLKAKMRKED